MIDTSPFTDEQWHRMCSAEMEMPVPLHEADLTIPFVYSRKYGVFYVGIGRHQYAMSTLLGFDLGMSPSDAADSLGLNWFEGSADHWLINTEGSAFMSSLSGIIWVGRPDNLNAYERRWLKPVEYVNPKGVDDN